jgi:hypothetical protein
VGGKAWGGHGNNVVAPLISGQACAWIGYYEDEADARCWDAGLGYGDDWHEEMVSPPVSYTGNGSVSLSFRYWNDTEQDFDSTTVWAERSDGARKWLVGLSGQIGDPQTDTYPTWNGTIPSGFLSGSTSVRLG